MIDFLKRWKKHLLALPALCILFFIFQWVYHSCNKPKSDIDFKNTLLAEYRVRGVAIPKDLNFCGELIPISDPQVKENFEEELFLNVFDQEKTLLLNKKANRWFKIIEPILKKFGVPDDFKYVAIVESGFVNSPDGPNAAGFWGLMIPVAQNYGLEINNDVDERFNVEKATEAACKCVKEAYSKYHNWILAAAAYDMGAGALDNQILKQKTNNYFKLSLNKETSVYIYRLLAFKEIISRPEAYGYKLKSSDLYYPIPYNVVKIDSTISNLSDFAIQHKSNLETLKLMNPWLLTNSLNNPDHKKYEIQFPKAGVLLSGMDKSDSIGKKSSKQIDTGNVKLVVDTLTKK